MTVQTKSQIGSSPSIASVPLRVQSDYECWAYRKSIRAERIAADTSLHARTIYAVRHDLSILEVIARRAVARPAGAK